MHPILFQIDQFQIHTYGATGAIGFLLVAAIALYRGSALGVKPERTADLIFWTSIAAIVGSRVVYLIQNPTHATTWYDWVNIRTGGLVFYGAVIAALPVGSLLMKRFKMPFYAMWDVFATAIPIAHGISRLGCLAAGCCWGLKTDVPWSITFTNPDSVAPLGVPMHPTQLYEAVYLFTVGLIVNLFYSRKQFDGQVMLLYLMLYAAGRTVLETFRGDETRGYFVESLFGDALTYSQGVSICLALIALGVFLFGAKRART
jgi:phosphatidylglycerol:prolipoprotein diacylglycerol transferase